LSVVEKEILGVERVGDIPGYLAPMIYFDFVESKQPEGMIGVLKHNEIDILSLITLYTHLTYQICGHDHSRTRNESFEIGRWFASLGEENEANQAFTMLVDGNDETSDRARMALAFQYKKGHEWDHALSLFMEVAKNKKNDELFLEACIEAAKIFEHKHKNYDLAIQYCKRALNALKNQNHQSQLLIRLKRLENKSTKFPG
jgi:tetratricopeptide (TPR) repeat protein